MDLLTKMSKLDKIKEDSFQNPQFIFKHSTRCSISKMVLNRFESTNDSASLVSLFTGLIKL